MVRWFCVSSGLLLLAPSLFGQVRSGVEASPLGVQECDTRCQTKETDCDLACDQVATCVDECKNASAACAQRCREAPPPSPLPVGSGSAKPPAPSAPNPKTPPDKKAPPAKTPPAKAPPSKAPPKP